MFGYVLPPVEKLGEEGTEQFRQIYCGLCHTLGRRYGFAARFILNYDLTYLAILLSAQEPVTAVCDRRCAASPFKKRRCLCSSRALELAADESIILAYWQVKDGVADSRLWKKLLYRFAESILRPAYGRAAALRPIFDEIVRTRLGLLAQLERENNASMDAPADTFAQLLAAGAEEIDDPVQKRVLRQLLYHLGRWVYLIDAADDLKKDAASGSYNPVALRYGIRGGELTGEARKEFVQTLDHSVHMIATAFELGDFGPWTELLETTFYDGLFVVGRAVLNGTFRSEKHRHKKHRLLRKPNERSLSGPGRSGNGHG